MNEQEQPGAACPDYADRLVDLSDGELPSGAHADVAAHVANCGACRAELGRLNASLTALQRGIVAAPVIPRPRARRLARNVVLIGVGGTAAAIVLAVSIAALLKAPASGRGDGPSTASAGNLRSEPSVPAPNTLTTGQGFEGQGVESGDTLTAEDALRQIALLEQQARLETSLALMPDDPWFADRRAANEALLATFREAATATGQVDHSPNQTPGKKGTL